jgi:thiol-disulfide isomerase/thioredoxin
MDLPSRSFRVLAFSFILAAWPLLSAHGDEDNQPTLTIGSPAPELNVEHWVQDGDGAFKPVTKFAPDQIYIVEFWATWCGPCIASMPHISKLQTEYADKDVQVVSISDEPLETVERFLARDVAGKEGTTYADLTKVYCLTTDPDRSVYKDYMNAAKQRGIPTAFIVGKTGRIDWIGHPMSMDEPLQAIVNGTWDRDAFATEFTAKQASDALLSQVGALIRRDRHDEALEQVNKAIEDAANPSIRKSLLAIKLQVVFATNLTDGLSELVQEILEGASSPQDVNEVTWRVYQTAAAGRLDDEALLKTCLRASNAAAKKASGEQRGYILDTSAHLQHLLGRLDQAIKTQKRALKLVEGRTRSQMELFLKQLEVEKSGDDTKGDDGK